MKHIEMKTTKDNIQDHSNFYFKKKLYIYTYKFEEK
jgi:hypothetical protein